MIRLAKNMLSVVLVITLILPHLIQYEQAFAASSESQGSLQDIREKVISIKKKVKDSEQVRDKVAILKDERTTLADEIASLPADEKSQKAVNDKLRQRKADIENLNTEIKKEFEDLAQIELTTQERSSAEAVEPDFIYETQSFLTPNDPEYPNQWGLQYIVNGVPNIQEGGKKVTVAVIDTGVDFTNLELQGSMWSRVECVSSGGEVITGGCTAGGYDFIDDDNSPAPSHDQYSWHGTAVAGVIAATSRNGTGVASLGGGYIEIMGVRASADGFFSSGDIADAIRFAVNNGAQIINISFGGPTHSQAIEEALRYAEEKKVLVVAAAGNYGTDNDVEPIYPASYDFSNIVSVAAHDQASHRSNFSNYGNASVDIAAPGLSIRTISNDGGIYSRNGTSFSTPFVTAVAGYRMASVADADSASVISFLLSDEGSFANSELIGIKDSRILKLAASFEETAGTGDTSTDGQANNGEIPQDTLTQPSPSPAGDTAPTGIPTDSLYYSDVMRTIAEVKNGVKQAQNSTEQQNADGKKSKILSKKNEFLEKEKERLEKLGVEKKRQEKYFEFLEKQFKRLEATDDDAANKEPIEINIPEKPSQFKSRDKDLKIEVTSDGENDFRAFDVGTGVDVDQAQLEPDNENIIINSEIQALAEELEHNPAKIFAYVRNKISYEPYFGAKKGSIGCLAEKVCNDTDASSLLIALLRAAGIPAQYKTATVKLPVGVINNLLGVEETKTAYFAFFQHGVPVYVLSGNQVPANFDDYNFAQETHLVLDWTFVEAYYDSDEKAGNYRNTVDFSAGIEAAITAHPELAWMPIDAVIGKYENTHKEIVPDTANFDSLSFFNSFLQYQGDLSPLQKLTADLQAQTGKNITDVNFHSTHTKNSDHPETIPPTPPYLINPGSSATSATLPASLKNEVKISLLRKSDNSPVFQKTFAATAVDNLPLELKYEGVTQTDKDTIASYGGIHGTPAGLVDITPVLVSADETNTSASSVSIGETLILQLEYLQRGQVVDTNQKFSLAGNAEGIYIVLSKVRDNPDLGTFATEDENNSAILLEGNAELARQYLKGTESNWQFLSEVFDRKNTLFFSRAVVTQTRALNSSNGAPTTFDFSGLTIDAGFGVVNYSRKANYKLHEKDLFLLGGLQASYDEAQILSDITGLSAISTVKGLQYASKNPENYTIYTINSSNESAIDTLNLSVNTKANMHADVQKGRTIITPNKVVTSGIFTGILYISLAPYGGATYAIGEQSQQNGGLTDMEVILVSAPISCSADNSNSEQAHQIREAWRSFVNKGLEFEFKYIEGGCGPAVTCKIEKTLENSIESGAGYDPYLYGPPCGKYTPEFGNQKYVTIHSSHGAKFYKDGEYSYWISRSQVIEKLKSAVSNYNNNKPDILKLTNPQIKNGTFGFNPKAYTFSQAGSFDNPEEPWGVSDRNLLKAYYSPNSSGGKGSVVYGYSLAKLNDVIGKIGFPTDNRGQAVATAKVKDADRYYQTFFNGQIYSYDYYNFRRTYFTYGNIWKKHDLEMGGTNSVLGFPISDPQKKQNTIIQFFEEDGQGRDHQLSWSGEPFQVASMKVFRNYECNNPAWASIDNQSYASREILLKLISFQALADTAVNTGEDLGELGDSLKQITIQELKDNVNLVIHPRQSLSDMGNSAQLVIDLWSEFDAKAIMNAYASKTNQAIADWKYELSLANCKARQAYIEGRIAGEIILMVVPAGVGKNILQKASKVTKAAKITVQIPRARVVSQMGMFGKSIKLVDQNDIAKWTAAKAAPSAEKGVAGETFWRQFQGGITGRTFEAGDLGGRNVDAYDATHKIAYEIKNFAARPVKLDDSNILNEINKDIYLMNNDSNYKPVWVFLEQGPNGALQEALEKNGIEFFQLVN